VRSGLNGAKDDGKKKSEKLKLNFERGGVEVKGERKKEREG